MKKPKPYDLRTLDPATLRWAADYIEREHRAWRIKNVKEPKIEIPPVLVGKMRATAFALGLINRKLRCVATRAERHARKVAP